MKATYKTQEILLIIDSSVLKRELLRNGNANAASDYSTEDNVQEACWNGLVDEWLPEVVNTRMEKMFIWQIELGSRFVCIQLSKGYPDISEYESIDPYCFQSALSVN